MTETFRALIHNFILEHQLMFKHQSWSPLIEWIYDNVSLPDDEELINWLNQLTECQSYGFFPELDTTKGRMADEEDIDSVKEYDKIVEISMKYDEVARYLPYAG